MSAATITGQLPPGMPPLVLPPSAIERIDQQKPQGAESPQKQHVEHTISESGYAVYTKEQLDEMSKLFEKCFKWPAKAGMGPPQFVAGKWKKHQQNIRDNYESLRASLKPHLDRLKRDSSSGDLAGSVSLVPSATVSSVIVSGQATPPSSGRGSPKPPSLIPEYVVEHPDVAYSLSCYLAMQKQIKECEKAYAKAFPIDLSNLAKALEEILKIPKKQLEVLQIEFLRFIRTAFEFIAIPKKGNCFPEAIARGLLLHNDPNYSKFTDPGELATQLRHDVTEFMKDKADDYGAFIIDSPDEKVYAENDPKKRYEHYRRELAINGKYFGQESMQPAADMLKRYQFHIYMPESVRVVDGQIVVNDNWIYKHKDTPKDAPIIHLLYTERGQHYSLLIPKVSKA